MKNARNNPRRDPLRHVRLDGYTLQTWDTGRTDRRGKTLLAYEFRKPDGTILFEGSDFAVAPSHPIDSDRALRSLLGFLTLKPGDTDREYFDGYTTEQMAFARGDAEQLQIWVMDDDAPEFENLDGFEPNPYEFECDRCGTSVPFEDAPQHRHPHGADAPRVHRDDTWLVPEPKRGSIASLQSLTLMRHRRKTEDGGGHAVVVRLKGADLKSAIATAREVEEGHDASNRDVIWGALLNELFNYARGIGLIHEVE